MGSRANDPLSHAPPKVSVVIPHYNRPERLAATLQTVMDQSFTSWEAVVVDDASPIDFEALVGRFASEPRIRFVRLDVNSGPSAARNRGVSEARGAFVAFLDSDDRWAPTKLEKQIDAVLAATDPDRVFVTTQIRKFTQAGISISPTRAAGAGESFAEYLIQNGGVVQTSSVLLSRKAALEVRFDSTLRQFEDYLFFLHAGAAGLQHRIVLEPLVDWYNDERDDRLSRGLDRNMRAAERFLTSAGNLIDKRSRLVFLTKHVGVLAIRSNPALGCTRLAAAVTLGLIDPRIAVSTAANGLLPPKVLRALKRRDERPITSRPP